MKSKIKICKLLLFFLLPFLALCSTIPSFAAEKDVIYNRIQQKKELVVGLSADYAPFEFHADVNNKDQVVGSDISVAKKIAKDLGVKLKIEELGFDALLGALKTEKIDLVISGMTTTPERKKEVNFSTAYMQIQPRIIIRKSDKKKFQTIHNFKGTSIGVQKQTTQEELIKTKLQKATPVSLQKIPDIIMNLQNKKIDAAVLDEQVAEAYVAHHHDFILTNITFKGEKKPAAVALSKTAPLLEKHINISIQEINDKKLLNNYKKEATKLMFKDNQNFIQKYGKFYLTGAGYTIFLAFIGVLFGVVIGSLLALMKLSKSKIFKAIAIIYIEYVRGTPLLVQIFIVYFGSGVLGIELSKLTAGCMALALNSGAYVAEIIRAGINAINKGQMEAARSLGMNYHQAMRYIVFPQAIKNILPALGNEFVTVIKESSVVSIIGVSELIFQTGNVQGASFKPFLPYLIVSLIYFALTFTISRLLGIAERSMKTSD